MNISDAQYQKYVADCLKLPQGKRKEHLAQLDTLIERLKKASADVDGLSIKKFLKTGSMRKGTVLKPKYGSSPDADLAVFIEIDMNSEVLDRLHALLKEMLVKAYPNKNPDDFTLQPRTLGIVFIDSGLELDLVPVIPMAGDGDYGWQPSSLGKALLKTSVSGQLAFIRSYKERYAHWTDLVRLLKRWRNNHELGELRSFTIELIVCYLQATKGVPPTIEEGLSRFWLFVAGDLASQRVAFSKAHGGLGDAIVAKTGVIVVDPVNAENNVASRIGESALVEIQCAAETAWELHHESITFGSKGSTVDNLRTIFGTDFTYE